ncbi:Bud site selection protein 20 [Podochytrium sp. JEL0797]|nr:Bud site selection protein 20 [Podochytrium sp. JEL0797]
MTRMRRKKNPHNIRDVKRASRTRARTKDLDQIQEEMAKGTPVSHEIDPELPGLGQFFCPHCAKYFVSQAAQDVHSQSKPHKKRVKVLLTPAYTQREAEAAVGLKTDNTRGKKPAAAGMNVDEPVVHEGIFANLTS